MFRTGIRETKKNSCSLINASTRNRGVSGSEAATSSDNVHPTAIVVALTARTRAREREEEE